jgi:CRISPR system Cascade subunit CasE
MMLLHNLPMTHPALLSADWGNGRSAHRAVMGLLGPIDTPDEASARAAAAVLFRLEPHADAPDGTTGRVLVQSDRPLRLRGDATVRTTDLTAHLNKLTAGTHVRLLLRANTVRTINCTCTGNGPRPKAPRAGITPHTHRVRLPEDQLPDWTAQRLQQAVQLDTTTITATVYNRPVDVTIPAVKHVPRDSRLDQHAQLIANDLYTTGVVTDTEQLNTLVTSGVGRGKAYGCGMLTVIRA